MFRRLRDLSLLILSAAALSAPFHFGALWPLAFFAFLPYFWVIEEKRPLDAFKYSFVFGVIFYAFTAYPLIYVTVAGYAAVCLYLALYVALFGMLVSVWQDTSAEFGISSVRKNVRSLLFLPAAWVLMEYFRGWFLSGVPLALLGYTQWRNLLLIQIADAAGVYGVSYFVLFVNLAFFRLVREFFSRAETAPTQRAILLGALVLAFGIVGGYGFFRLEEWKNFYRDPTPKTVLRVTVTQGNIPQDQKWNARIKGLIFEKYRRLTLMGATEKADLIVWPETAFPGFLEDEALMSARLRGIVRQAHAEVLVGAPTMGDFEAEGVRFFNSAVHYGADGEEKRRHHKLHLVPFGEFVPFESFLGFIRQLVPIGKFAPGREWTLFDTKARQANFLRTVRFAALICYEDMFPSMVRRFCRKGADFLVNITNDAWFGDTSASYQHAQASVFRAVENRVNVVRAANTGLSCFIAPTGLVAGSVQDKGKEIFVTGHETRDIIIRKTGSFYKRFGDVFVGFLAAAAVLIYRDRERHSIYNRF